tara:strand:+ start:39980 stop:40264 length:285 start_codon:yes stop_codon:yes gene_type:complete
VLYSAFRLPGLTSFAHVSIIVCGSANVDVVGVDAAAVVALVASESTFFDSSEVMLIDCAMRSSGATFMPELSIPVRCDDAIEIPASCDVVYEDL